LGPLDATWHLLNFFAPALAVGALTAVLAKLVWWRELRAVPWLPLGGWGSVGAVVGLVAALVVFGRDGKMAGYGLMLVACSAGLWWRGLRG
jgi:hypothetical protein